MGAEVALLEPAGRWPADVEIWSIKMSFAIPHGLASEHLDASERARAGRYYQAQDRIRFSTTRSMLRELLGQRLNRAPADLHFVIGEYGRPELSDSEGVSFNVSHSGDHALVAISTNRTVGIDIERMNNNIDWRDLIEMVCIDHERRTILMEPARLQYRSFYRCWTAKEAILKALGLGITEGLRSVAVHPSGEGIQQAVMGAVPATADARALRFHWMSDFADYMGCIAFGPARLCLAEPAISGDDYA